MQGERLFSLSPGKHDFFQSIITKKSNKRQIKPKLAYVRNIHKHSNIFHQGNTQRLFAYVDAIPQCATFSITVTSNLCHGSQQHAQT